MHAGRHEGPVPVEQGERRPRANDQEEGDIDLHVPERRVLPDERQTAGWEDHGGNAAVGNVTDGAPLSVSGRTHAPFWWFLIYVQQPLPFLKAFSDALQEALGDELQRARALWHRKYASQSGVMLDVRESARRARYLQSHGFTTDIIRKLLAAPDDE